MLAEIQYRLLKRFFPRKPERVTEVGYERNTSLRALLGADFLNRIAKKTVIDFGCGTGVDAIEMAKAGAERVIGIDIREDFLRRARQKAIKAEVEWKCSFVSSTDQRADVIVSLDSFEHFAEPAAVLETVNALLKPQGEVIISFGWTWYHPFGGHLFSVFPWAHLIFTEKALIRWRATFKHDGATRFGEVAGGLNRMTISRFERLVAASPFKIAELELVPIKAFRWAHQSFTREFTTSLVRCRLVKRHPDKAAAGFAEDGPPFSGPQNVRIA